MKVIIVIMMCENNNENDGVNDSNISNDNNDINNDND